MEEKKGLTEDDIRLGGGVGISHGQFSDSGVQWRYIFIL